MPETPRTIVVASRKVSPSPTNAVAPSPAEDAAPASPNDSVPLIVLNSAKPADGEPLDAASPESGRGSPSPIVQPAASPNPNSNPASPRGTDSSAHIRLPSRPPTTASGQGGKSRSVGGLSALLHDVNAVDPNLLLSSRVPKSTAPHASKADKGEKRFNFSSSPTFRGSNANTAAADVPDLADWPEIADVSLMESLNKITLKFKDSKLEDLYSLDYFKSNLSIVRRAVFISVLIWILFVINDVLKDRSGERKNIAATVGLRFALVGLTILVLILSYKVRINTSILIYSVALFVVLFGSSQIVFGLIEGNTVDPTYCVFIPLMAAMSSSYFKLPFNLSVLANFSLWGIFLILTGAFSSYPSLDRFASASGWILVALVLFTIHSYSREISMRGTFLASKRLEAEEAKSQRVLAKMLPMQVVEELRSGADFVYDKHHSVSVLFSHIHDFDDHTALLSPKEVVAMLNHLFSRFDQLTDEHGLYKVETIGDVYLISSGVPDPREDHASALTLLAMAMMKAMASFQEEGKKKVELKIGINSGALIAGVIGMKYPRFRLMGDCVNTASRMSTTCEAGDIQVSNSTFELLSDEFICQYRGEIAVKGKGMMKTYLVKQFKKRKAHISIREGEHHNYGHPRGYVHTFHHEPTNGELYSSASIPPEASFHADKPAELRALQLSGAKCHLLRKNVAGDSSPPATDKHEVLVNPHEVSPAKLEVNDLESIRAPKAVASGNAGSTDTSAQSPRVDASPSPTGATRSLASPTNASSPSPPSSPDGLKISASAVKGSSLFNLPNWDQLQHPHNPFDLKFYKNPDLERQFQEDFASKFTNTSRLGMTTFVIGIFCLGLQDTFLNLPGDSYLVYLLYLTWGLRIGAMAIGCLMIMFTYTHTALFHRYMQPIIYLTWLPMSCALIQTWIEYDEYVFVYGICCTLMLITMSAFFMGLQFRWVVINTISILLYYIIASIIINRKVPLVIFFLLAVGFLSIAASYGTEYGLRLDFIRYLKVGAEEKRTRHFLDNMLPKSVISQIKKEHTFIGDEFPNVSVLFCDIVSFTTLAARLNVEDVVVLLNIYFGAMDALTTKHNVYKVETIGDAYLACSNVVDRNSTATEDLVRFALDAQLATQYFFSPDGKPIVTRIGIHTGTVLAGVVGKKMPRYHLFGEHCTIAEEMEQNGIPGNVVVSENTYENIKDLFEFEEIRPLALHQTRGAEIKEGEGEFHFIKRYRVVAFIGRSSLNEKGELINLDRAEAEIELARQLHNMPNLGLPIRTPRFITPQQAATASSPSPNGTGSSRSPASVSPLPSASKARRFSIDGSRTEPAEPEFDEIEAQLPPPFVMDVLGKVHDINMNKRRERHAAKRNSK